MSKTTMPLLKYVILNISDLAFFLDKLSKNYPQHSRPGLVNVDDRSCVSPSETIGWGIF